MSSEQAAAQGGLEHRGIGAERLRLVAQEPSMLQLAAAAAAAAEGLVEPVRTVCTAEVAVAVAVAVR